MTTTEPTVKRKLFDGIGSIFKVKNQPRLLTYNRETRRLAAKIGVPPSIMLAMQRLGLIKKGQRRVPAREIMNFIRLEKTVKEKVSARNVKA